MKKIFVVVFVVVLLVNLVFVNNDYVVLIIVKVFML